MLIKNKFALPAIVIDGQENDPEQFWVLSSDKEEIFVHLSEVLRRPAGYVWQAEFGGYIDSWSESLEIIKVYPSGTRLARYSVYSCENGTTTQLFLCRPRENRGGFR